MEKTTDNQNNQNQSRAAAEPVAQRREESSETLAFEDNRPEAAAQRRIAGMMQNSPQHAATSRMAAMMNGELVQRTENKTGLPDDLKSGMENLSGMSMDHVKVHYNSSKPAQLNAHAFAQGSEIHLASGQEKHLPHELGHVVQQAQGRVRPTVQMAGVGVNDDDSLEREADMLGERALQMVERNSSAAPTIPIHLAAGQKRYLTKHQQGMGSGSRSIQRVIAANPVAVNQAGIIAAGGVAMDMGVTDQVAGAVVPTYNIVAPAVDGGFEATVVKTANAFEGNSNAVYLQRGIYPSGLMLNAGILGPFAAGPGNRQVYADLLAVNSNLSRMAEQEHLDDLRRAFEITLDIADQALDQAVAHGPYGVHATAALAQNAAEADINARIALIAGLLGTAPFAITNNLALLYQNKQALTNTGRDGLGFHTFDINRNNESTSSLAWAMYLLTFLPGVENKDFREVITGPAFNVPGPASNVVVT